MRSRPTSRAEATPSPKVKPLQLTRTTSPTSSSIRSPQSVSIDDPAMAGYHDRKRQDLQQSVERERRAVETTTVTSVSILSHLPSLDQRHATKAIRQSCLSPVWLQAARLCRPSTSLAPSRKSPPRGAAPLTATSPSVSAAPSSQQPLLLSPLNILNPTRRRTTFEREVEKRHRGLGVLTQLDREGEEMVTVASLGAHHNDVARRKFQLQEETALNRLLTFYEREDARDEALTGMSEREHEKRIQLWLTILAAVGRTQQSVQALREHRAKKVLTNLFKFRFLAHLQRRRAKFRRHQILKDREEHMTQRPTKQQLRKVACMRSLSDASLGTLIDGMDKMCFIAGEFVAKQGTVGTGAYFIQRGAVELVQPAGAPESRVVSPTSPTRGRLRSPSTAGGVLSGRRFDEGFAAAEHHLLTEELHEFGIQALQDTDIWFLSRRLFLELVERLPPAQAEPVHRMLDERRERNMIINRSLSEDFVRHSSPLFANWTTAGLKRLVDVAMPAVFRKGDTVVSPGQFGRSVVFVVRGKLTVTDGKRTDTVREGQAVGEVAAARGLKDRTTEIKAANGCDCWVLQRMDFAELMCHESPMSYLPSLMLLADELEKERAKH